MNKVRKDSGGFGIENLMKYVIALSIIGAIIGVLKPALYYNYLSLDVASILNGQVWRLFTFLLFPKIAPGRAIFIDIIWFAVWVFLYYYVGKTLEQMWGKAKFTLFYLTGMIVIVLVCFGFYFFYYFTEGPTEAAIYSVNMAMYANAEELNSSLFLAFASLFPNAQFMLYFVIPVKAKWLSFLYIGVSIYNMVRYVMAEYYFPASLIIAALANFFVFYVIGRKEMTNPKVKFKKKSKPKGFEYKGVKEPTNSGQSVHKCAICGRTEKDDKSLDFRYCSKCDGNYEYCSDHLFTHEHVHH